MKMTAKVNQKELQRAFRAFAATSKKSTETLMIEQGGLLIRDVVMLTPPGNKKSAGTKRVRSDIRSIMRESRRSDAKDPRAVHRQFRTRNGRVAKAREKVPVRGLAAYIREKVEMVGFLKAGWKAAADKLRARIPAWVSRHNRAPGNVSVKLAWPQNNITAENQVSFAGDIKGIDRRINYALNMRIRAMVRQTEAFLNRAASRANLK